ncbi:MAG TPA: hypothetical protein VF115_09805 [Acidimicrobiia bacterium]
MSLVLTEPRVSASRFGWERVALLGLLVIQLALAVTLPVAGPVSIDEVVYSEMTRNLTDGYGFFIDNGYDELASPEMATRLIRPTTDGNLAAQYPYGLPMLAAPAYAVLGTRGIMVLNAVAFVAVVALTYLMAKRLLDNRWIARVAAGVLVMATYVWEYSIAIWPHMTTLAFGLGSVLAMLVAGDGGSKRRTAAYAALAGLLFGFAVLNRLDAVLLLPVLAVCLYRRSAWVRAAMSFLVGATPSAAILSFSNWQRWGTPLPFSYGGSITGWLVPIVGTGVGFVLLTAGMVYAVRRFSRLSGRAVTFLTSAALLMVFAVPFTRRFILDTIGGIWTLVVDLRNYGISDEEGLVRLADGSLVYFGTVKKSLLQSAPYLVLIALPVVTAWRTAQRRTALLLVIPIVTYIGFYAPRAWHGGLSFNLRYFLPLLPFAAILTAWGLRIVVEGARIDSEFARVARFIALGTLALFAAGRIVFSSIQGSAWLFSIPPMIIAAATAVAVVFLISRPSEQVARLALVFAVIGLTWAGAVAYGYDAAATLNIRNSHAETSSAIAELIGGDSLLIADWPDNVYGVKDHLDNVFVALPSNDDYATFDDVLTHFAATRTVYGAMTPASWDQLPGQADAWIEIGAVGDYSVRRLGETPGSLSVPSTARAS